MNILILFFISALPVVLLGLFVYKKDKNKEPISLLIKLFVGGILSCFLVLIVTLIATMIFPILGADHEELNLFQLLINVFIGIALIEELCKWIISYSISFNNKHCDEVYDMIIHCVFVSLGFAFFENLLYVIDGGIQVGIMRALLAVPGHVCDAIFMGYFLGLAKINYVNNDNKKMYKNISLSILVPTILHGIYDYCLFAQNAIFIIIFFIFVITMYVLSLKKVKIISTANQRFKYNDKFCTNCGTAVNSNYCPICGRKNI